jgi:hypothetical protein
LERREGELDSRGIGISLRFVLPNNDFVRERERERERERAARNDVEERERGEASSCANALVLFHWQAVLSRHASQKY